MVQGHIGTGNEFIFCPAASACQNKPPKKRVKEDEPAVRLSGLSPRCAPATRGVSPRVIETRTVGRGESVAV